MGFKQNLLKKIEADQLASQVIRSLKTTDSGSRFDKSAMRQLLSLGEFPSQKERDLEIYILENDAEKKKLLVLDNGLAIYHTTLNDVCMRKSPTVKEMLSIRNAFKILNDKDVVISKKEKSVKTVQSMVTAGLDLTYTAADIEQIEKEGQASLEGRYTDGVIEALSLFAELLDFEKVPRSFHEPHHRIWGRKRKNAAGRTVWSPIVAYAMADNRLQLIDTPIDPLDTTQLDHFRQVIDGQAEPAGKGLSVFTHLKELVPECRI